MSDSTREYINKLKYALQTRQILEWGTTTRHRKFCQEHLTKIEAFIESTLTSAFKTPSDWSECGGIPVLVKLLHSQRGREAAKAARGLLSATPPSWGSSAGKTACVSAGAIPVLANMMSSSKEDEAYNAMIALRHLMSGDAVNTATCVKFGIILELVKLLSSNIGVVHHLAILILENIAQKENAYKLECIKAGAIPELIRIYSSDKGYTGENAAYALQTILRGDNACRVACVEAGAIPLIVGLIKTRKHNTRGFLHSYLEMIVGDSEEYKRLVVEAGYNLDSDD